ncbi:MAG: Ig-like domain-containing protein, partial [Myxococcota bacterium]
GDVDLRSDGIFRAYASEHGFVARIADCGSVGSVRFQTDGVVEQVASTDLVPDEFGVCSVSFKTDAVAPSITLSRTDGTTQTVTETFAEEQNRPSIALADTDGVRIVEIDGTQHLVVTLVASDDTDLTHVSASILGLRASGLRAVGGAVERAREGAFADTGGYERQVPKTDTQTSFSFTAPITDALDQAAIASDGVVLVEAYALDASGNEASLSELLLTGESLSDAVTGFALERERLVFSHALQTERLTPVVTYQFRGPVELPGEGRGITYVSSHPDLIRVTDSGLVYPLKETGGQTVTITATHSGGRTDTIDVVFDATLELVRLEVEGVTAQAPLHLPRLEAYFPIPPVVGVFVPSGGGPEESFALGEDAPIVRQVTAGDLELNEFGQVLAREELVGGLNPGGVELWLESATSIRTTVEITADDAPPTARLTLPGQVKVGDRLELRPSMTDDVGIAKVAFLMDGAQIAVRERAPFELTLDVAEHLEGKALAFTVIAEDTAGQTVTSAPRSVVVRASDASLLPTLKVEAPEVLQRVVAGGRLSVSASTVLGKEATPSSIGYVEVRLDGAPATRLYNRAIEERCLSFAPDSCEFVEVWRGMLPVPSPGVSPSTQAAQFVPCTFSSCEDLKSASRLFVVVDNQTPIARILGPADSSTISAGQRLAVEVEVADDTLGEGTQITLERGDTGEVLARTTHAEQGATQNALSLKSVRHTFVLQTDSYAPGDTIELVARARDYHGDDSTSNRVRVTVRGDQPPTVAISSPAVGSTHVSGQKMFLRAQASDDLGVDRVEFLVDGVLKGTDQQAPYAFTYEIPPDITRPQPVTLEAIAYDTNDQQAQSADVVVTVGPDDQQPVVNLVSPAVTAVGAQDEALVVENTQVLLRVSGYDNVGVTSLELKNVCRVGDAFRLHNAPGVSCSDPLTAPFFKPEPIPGPLNGFTGVLLFDAPAHQGAGSSDVYPIEVVAKDEAGNTSTLAANVRVEADEPPEVLNISTARPRHLKHEEALVSVLARDDV